MIRNAGVGLGFSIAGGGWDCNDLATVKAGAGAPALHMRTYDACHSAKGSVSGYSQEII